MASALEDRKVGAAVVIEAIEEPPPTSPRGREVTTAHTQERPPAPGTDKFDRDPGSPVWNVLQRSVIAQLALSCPGRGAAGVVLRVLGTNLDGGRILAMSIRAGRTDRGRRCALNEGRRASIVAGSDSDECDCAEPKEDG